MYESNGGREVDFAIVGAQKSGSSAIHQALRDHPRVHMDPTEFTFFEHRNLRPVALAEAMAEREPQARGKLLGVKRPNYLSIPYVPERLAEHSPGVKILAVLRNPFERVVSAYFHLLRYNQLPLAPLDEGLARMLDGAYDDIPHAATLIDYSLYGESLERYQDFFAHDRFHVTLHEELVQGFQTSMDDIFGFLGLEPHDVSEFASKRPQQVIYNLDRIGVLRIANRFQMKLDDRDLSIGSVASLTDDQKDVIQKIRAFDQQVLAPHLPKAKPTLSITAWERLSEYFLPDVEKLERFLGRSLAHWKEPPRDDANAPPVATLTHESA